jgi:hypothetical protein
MKLFILAFVFGFSAVLFLVLGLVVFPEPPMNYLFFGVAGLDALVALFMVKKGLIG